MALALSKPLVVAIPKVGRRRALQVQTPRLSAVIVNYRQWDNTTELVRQLRASKSMQRQTGEIIIVDNRSPGNRAARRLRRLPGISLRRWGRNRGFARAVNEGCRLSRGEWVLLLNPDMSLPHHFLDKVLALTERLAATCPRAGIVGLGLRNEDGSRQLSAGFFPTLAGSLCRLVLPRWKRKYHATPENQSVQVDWVTGCGMLIRRDCLDDLDGFDRDFFLYYEDVDFCRRARAKGWEVRYEPNIDAVHHNPLHSRTVPAALRVVTRHSLLTYAWKHWPRPHFQLLATLVRLESSVRKLLSKLRGQCKSAGLYADLAKTVRELQNGNPALARARIMRLAREQQFYENE